MAMDLPTITDTDAYHEVRANGVWAGLTVPDKQAALTRASDYVRMFYMGRFIDELESNDATYLEGVMLVAPEFTTVRAVEQTDPVQSIKKSMDGLGSLETVYRKERTDRFPQLTRLFRPILKGQRLVR